MSDPEWMSLNEALQQLGYGADPDRAVSMFSAAWLSGQLIVEGGSPFERIDSRYVTGATLRPTTNTVAWIPPSKGPPAANQPSRRLCAETGSVRWHAISPVYVSRSSFLESFGATTNRRRGRSKVDWDLVKRQAFFLMDKNGDFIPGDPEWNAQARLEEALVAYCLESQETDVSQNRVRSYVATWLPEWRKSQAMA